MSGRTPPLESTTKSDASQAASLSLGVVPAVNLSIKVNSGFDMVKHMLHAFDVVGPPAELAFLQLQITKNTPSGLRQTATSRMRVSGLMSPLQLITLTAESRLHAGVPEQATAVSFVYPLPGLKDAIQRLIDEGHLQPWLFMCLLGGFCYFNASGSIVQSNALVLTENPPVQLHLVGPYPASDGGVQYLVENERMQVVTIKSLREIGFLEFCWVLAKETPGGA